MTPLERYQAAIASGEFVSDPAQQKAIVALNQRYQKLLKSKDLLSFLPFGPKQAPQTGLYLYSGVGRGKTWLMELFYQSLKTPHKKFYHFHRLMQWVHEKLKKHQGKKEPIAKIAKTLAKHTKVLCVDEMFVSDIADAMLLGTLFRYLIDHDVMLIMTSNLPPEKLYWNGLQREKFLPAIALLEKYCEVLHLDSPTDYRFQHLSASALYFFPLNAQTDEAMANLAKELAPLGQANQTLSILEREIATRYLSDSVVWFDFEAICETPRSYLDYIEIARCFHTVLISGAPILTPEKEDVARRFIALIDELYARNVVCVISAEVDIPSLYQGERHRFEFERTQSRLHHMQQAEYLKKPHIP